MTYLDIERKLLAVNSLDGLEYKHEAKILSLFNDYPLESKDKIKQYLLSVFSESKAKTIMLSLQEDYIQKTVNDLEKQGVCAVTIYSKNYPERLKNIDTPPLVLYCKGKIELLNAKKTFAAVGSRKTLAYADSLLKDFTEKLSKSGVVIVSGSATGADKTAISSALASGNVISVLAGGMDHIYPECNKSLIEKIAKNGLIISEQPPHIAPQFWMFPVRNRIIAGLGDSVLIASGSKTSGARHTADFALNYGKQVFAFPYSVGISSGELCNDLIKHGATLCDDVMDIFEELGVQMAKEEEIIDLDEDELKIYQAIASGQEDMTKYCLENNIKFFEIAPALSSLEIQGLIVKLPGNKYKPVKK